MKAKPTACNQSEHESMAAEELNMQEAMTVISELRGLKLACDTAHRRTWFVLHKGAVRDVFYLHLMDGTLTSYHPTASVAKD